jgi:hypothetical protein
MHLNQRGGILVTTKKKTVHMIGNAHIDPVWRWRFGDGLAEIKATFRSALDRIAQYDDFIFTAAGALIGLVLRSVIATAVLGIMFFMIPLWRLKLYRNKYRKYMTAQLESTTSLVTISYIRCNSFIQAVEENIDQISPIVRPKFQKFLDECKVNASVKNCVRNLRDSIDNSLFREWCEIVLKTLDNSEMKEALLPICEKYTNVKIVQDEIDSEVLGSLAEYIIMMLFMLFCYPLVWFLNAEWFAYYSTFPGKFVVGYTLIVLFFSIIKMISVLQPVDYDR